METMETAEYKGKLYQIGAFYEFSDSGSCWLTDTLRRIREDDAYPFGAEVDPWKFCREVNSSCGTITDAPIKLVDGAIYVFDNNVCRISWVGYYSEKFNCFLPNSGTGGGSPRMVALLDSVSNIRLLVEA